MGDPKRSRKKWKGPRHPWRKEVLEEELKLMGEYGLRNKRELWIAKTMIAKIRQQARLMLALPPEELAVRQRQLISRLSKMGLLHEEATLDDVLGLRVEDLLERRLQTIVYRKGLARTIHEARQLIVHGHIAIAGRRVTSPGYIVKRDEEALIDYSPRSPFKERPLAAAVEG
ncbi:MAG: 30S ribosomal protein S4 [Candidatus Methanomethylicota archaeon]|uniref:Small ribosomal subunit protein uS4 n=1 Tax=Thermoproteota archaeon TaxID=2056631 RepID=A0A497F9K2_9CREN|nr:MAG: 30S ribosomal protein S4 [Candidatus Verstraetearchaeota archaeon]RLE55748.1 MAG: 30S ribosomal protein S4 [Candidatus Verstraetearchaeota archaeon]